LGIIGIICVKLGKVKYIFGQKPEYLPCPILTKALNNNDFYILLKKYIACG
jgi:hypothetical protein